MSFIRNKILLFIAIWALSRFCIAQTDGFTIRKITVPSHSQSEQAQTPSLLQQRFFYLAKGTQCYVFASEDGQSVLKILRQTPSALIPSKKRKEAFRNSLSEEKQSITLAAQALRSQTGIMYTHLDHQKMEKPLLLVDRLGIVHQVPAESMEFIVQKRAIPATAYIEDQLKTNPSLAKDLVMRLAHLVAEIQNKKICDFDPNFLTNFGFIDQEAIEFDIGRFAKYASPEREKYLERTGRMIDEYVAYLEKLDRELSLAFQIAAEAIER